MNLATLVAALSLWVAPSETLRRLVRVPTDATLQHLSTLTNQTRFHAQYLTPLLLPRPSMSDNHTRVRDHLIQQCTLLGMHVEQDTFSLSPTVVGSPMTFTNVMCTMHRQAPRQLVLAAHYDSARDPAGFVGATDSAAPIAIILETCASLLPYFRIQSQAYRPQAPPIGVQLIWFDGEEALKKWSQEDGIYGSKHLAAMWSQRDPLVLQSPYSIHRVTSRLEQMEVMVLLDLLGAPTPYPQIHDSFPQTHGVFEFITRIERRLMDLQLMSASHVKRIFVPKAEDGSGAHRIEDDHLPFMQLHVPILHWIPWQFPIVWHRMEDDAGALDEGLMLDYIQLLRVFVYRYLELNSSACSTSE